MQYYLLSFIAGILTILAPCVLPVIPVILGSSFTKIDNKKRPVIIIGSLMLSIIVFTLLLKSTTLLIQIDPRIWNYISGGIIFLFGVITVFPNLWEQVEIKLKLNSVSGNLLNKSSQRTGLLGDILIGAALGPVFASCSPTYALVVAVILPVSFVSGLVNLAIYSLGLGISLFAIVLLGQKLLVTLKWAIDPRGWFRILLGVVFVVLGLAIITGLEKKLEIALLDAGFADVTKVETYFLERLNN